MSLELNLEFTSDTQFSVHFGERHLDTFSGSHSSEW